MSRYDPCPVALSTSHRRTASSIVVAFVVVLSALAASPFANPASGSSASSASSASTAGSASLASASNLDPEVTVEGETGGDGTGTESTDGTGTDSTDGSPGSGASSSDPDVSEENDESSIVENPLTVGEDHDPASSASEDRKIWAVIGGLLLVALALTVLTVRYWRNTRPTGAKPASSRRSGRSTARSSSGGGGKRARSADEPAPHEELGSDDLFVDES